MAGYKLDHKMTRYGSLREKTDGYDRMSAAEEHRLAVQHALSDFLDAVMVAGASGIILWFFVTFMLP